MAEWTVEIYDPSGNRVADLVGKSLTRKIQKVRNRADTINLSYDIDTIKKLCNTIGITMWQLFAVNQNEVRIKRNGGVVSAGQIVRVQPSVDGDQRKVDIIAVGWFDLLGARKLNTAQSFTAEDAGQIAWGLIDYTQNLTNGDIGITLGSIGTSVDRDRNYESEKNIKDAIIQLSEVQNGFDFEVTWDKKFNVYYPKIGTLRNNVILKYPGNIRALNFTRDGLGMANQVTARGSGTGEDAFKITVDDLVGQGSYTLRQKTVDFSDVSQEDTLTEHANEELTFATKFTDIPDVTLDPKTAPEFGSYGIGDELPIRVDEDFDIFEPVNNTYRIDAMDIEIGVNNEENITLKMMN